MSQHLAAYKRLKLSVHLHLINNVQSELIEFQASHSSEDGQYNRINNYIRINPEHTKRRKMLR